jgi:hypothetical protein
VGEGRSYSPDKLLSVPDGLLFWGRAARKVGFYLLRTGSGWPECLGQTYAEGIRRLVDAPGGPLLFTTTSVTRLATDEKEIQILLVSGPYKSLLGKQIEGQAFRTVLKPFVRGRAESNPELLPAALGCLDALDAAIHRDELWAPYGETQIIILRRGTTMKDAEFIPNDILDGKRVRHFLSTPYGLVAVGEGGVGLVEGAQ